jgi:hypothetical protein
MPQTMSATSTSSKDAITMLVPAPGLARIAAGRNCAVRLSRSGFLDCIAGRGRWHANRRPRVGGEPGISGTGPAVVPSPNTGSRRSREPGPLGSCRVAFRRDGNLRPGTRRGSTLPTLRDPTPRLARCSYSRNPRHHRIYSFRPTRSSRKPIGVACV